MSPESVTVIGLGPMGRAMASALLRNLGMVFAIGDALAGFVVTGAASRRTRSG